MQIRMTRVVEVMHAMIASAVAAALEEARASLALYPEGSATLLREAIAELFHIDPARIGRVPLDALELGVDGVTDLLRQLDVLADDRTDRD